MYRTYNLKVVSSGCNTQSIYHMSAYAQCFLLASIMQREVVVADSNRVPGRRLQTPRHQRLWINVFSSAIYPYDCYMSEQDLTPPHETPGDPVEIRQDAAITIQDALLIAAEVEFSIGKSTMQRWAKAWGDKGAASPVKSVLVTSRFGSTYRLDRDDFKSWVFEQMQNMRPGEALRDPVRSHETPQDLKRPREALRDPERSDETSRDLAEPSSETRNQIMNLKIDLEVRKQLIGQAQIEITRQRDQIETLLRENGGLQTQLLQLAAPRGETTTPTPHSDNSQPQDGSAEGSQP